MDANELALVYRARGMSPEQASQHATEVLAGADIRSPVAVDGGVQHEAIGTGMRAEVSSFTFFASGALIPVIPFLLGAQGSLALVIAAILVGLALLVAGGVVGLLSGGGLLKRALRQIGIGYGAAAATYLLGLLLGATVG